VPKLILKRRKNSGRPVLNLRQICFEKNIREQGDVEIILDTFLYPLMKSKVQSAEIIVGKGTRSTTFFEGKNPLRYYTENYLVSLNLEWRDVGSDGFLNGIILVYFGE
jgi:hypothetical protein